MKLGTIEESGVADVYSYDEDDAVANPNLEKHLAHFGLKMKEMKKSEKSTVELELDMNQVKCHYLREIVSGCHCFHLIPLNGLLLFNTRFSNVYLISLEMGMGSMSRGWRELGDCFWTSSHWNREHWIQLLH